MPRFRTLVGASTIATFALIAVGGLVRATKSGLGCGTDWPHCSGRVIPIFGEPAVVIEYSHRLAAAAVVLLLGTLAVLAVRRYRDVPRIMWASIGAFGLVMFQAVLGAIVVKLELEAESVVLHLGTALSLLALLIYLWASVRAFEGDPFAPSDQRVSRSSRLAAFSVLGLMLLGSYISGTAGAGAAFDDWPLMNGKLVPDLAIEAQALHFAHRLVAAIVGVVVFAIGWKVIRRRDDNPQAARLAHVGMGLFAVEVLIGAANVFTSLNSAFVTAHLATGAAVWATFVATWVVTSPATQELAVRAGRTGSPALAESR